MFILAQNLIGDMKRMNMNLPARVWIPFYKQQHHVVRIAYTESTVLNSRDRVCIEQKYILFISGYFYPPFNKDLQSDHSHTLCYFECIPKLFVSCAHSFVTSS